MPYQRSDGTYINSQPLGTAAVSSAARVASGNGTSVETGSFTEIRGLVLDVTAASGTNPTLDVRVETSDDNTTWRTISSFAQATTVTNEHKEFGPLGRYVRIAWTIAGTATPSFTFSVGILGGELV